MPGVSRSLTINKNLIVSFKKATLPNKCLKARPKNARKHTTNNVRDPVILIGQLEDDDNHSEEDYDKVSLFDKKELLSRR